METPSAQAAKAELRARYRRLRQEYVNSEASVALQAHVERWLRDYAQDVQVALYQPLGEEAQFKLQNITDFFFPRVDGDSLRFYKPARSSDFQKGTYGVLEPLADAARELDSRRPAVVFCPAVAVDRKGGRLGMGKGYYDRFFSQHPEVIRVGVVYQIQVSETQLPADGWDQSLDWVVTDKMILRTSNRSVQ